MKINLIVLTPNLNYVEMPITNVIGLFTSLGYQFNGVNLLDYDFYDDAMESLVGNFFIVVAPFDNEGCLEKIRKTFDKVYTPPYQQFCYGYFIGNATKFGIILDKSLIQDFNTDIAYRQLSKLIEFTKTFNLKLFSLNPNEIIPVAERLSDDYQCDFAYFFKEGDMLLSFTEKSKDSGTALSLEQQVYRTFGNFIYNDKLMNIPDTLAEIMEVQKKKVVIVDNTTGKVFVPILQNYHLNNICFDNGIFSPKMDKFLSNLEKKSIDLCLIITEGNDGFNFTFYSLTNCKTEFFAYKSIQKSSKNTLLNFILYNILQKIHKNTW